MIKLTYPCGTVKEFEYPWGMKLNGVRPIKAELSADTPYGGHVHNKVVMTMNRKHYNDVKILNKEII